MIDAHRLVGVFPPVPTPFNENGAIYKDGFKQNFEFWNQHDLSGYLVLGSNGEAVLLDSREKTTLFEVARRNIPENKLMLIGTGCQSTKETIELTNGGASIGADAAVVLSPFYYKGLMKQEVLVKHFHAVADAATIPIIIYNMPACTGMDLSAETVAAIADHENIIGIKDSGGNMVKMQAINTLVKKPFSILAGSGSFLLPGLAVGASGGILALSNIAPQFCCRLYSLFRNGEISAATSLQNRLTPLNSAITSRWGVPALKAAMEMMGLYGGPVREPLLSFEESLKPTLKQIIDKALNIHAN
ncbi:MAG: dihydrodipicolinate synthase family protein [Saprospiraceae bacterium]|nr:dihydrodipicolinate synthase family protein [Saprospiraceae bacterium]